MLQLFSADGCPYAQRTRALLTYIDQPFELRTIDLKNKPPEFLALSPTGKVPMLLDGDGKLYESYVINEYLADRNGWAHAFSKQPFQKARERLAMAQFDNVVVPVFWDALKKTLTDQRRLAAERELDELARTVAAADEPVNLVAFHVVTHVVRWRWLGDWTPFPALLEARPSLSAWLDKVAALPAVQSTLPDRDATVALMKHLAARA
jgi:glutathione S-transferase